MQAEETKLKKETFNSSESKEEVKVAENKSVINDTLALSNIEESPMIKLFD